MAWSSGQEGGKRLAAFSSKIHVCCSYSEGSVEFLPCSCLSLFASLAQSCAKLVLATIVLHSMSIFSSSFMLIPTWFTCIPMISAAFLNSFHCCQASTTVFNVTVPSTIPSFQSTCGLKVLSQGYLSKTRSNLRSVCYDFSLFLTPTCDRTDFRIPNDRRDPYL